MFLSIIRNYPVRYIDFILILYVSYTLCPSCLPPTQNIHLGHPKDVHISNENISLLLLLLTSSSSSSSSRRVFILYLFRYMFGIYLLSHFRILILGYVLFQNRCRVGKGPYTIQLAHRPSYRKGITHSIYSAERTCRASLLCMPLYKFVIAF